MVVSRASVVVALILLGPLSFGCPSTAKADGRKPASASDQLAFGVQMARRGLWSEARFRFQQAAKLDPDNARITSNLAVAAEALGKFEEARDLYQQALRRNPSDAEIKRNYARFVEFYQGFTSGQDTKPQPGDDANASPAEKNDGGQSSSSNG